MPFIIPKIIYNSVTLDFTYPPVQKPGPQDGTSDERKREGSDSITMSGLTQSVTWRVDRFRILQMDNVPMEDLPNWAAFIDYAITGAPFDYYPDTTLSDFETWTLEDTEWAPKYNSRGLAKFTLKMRKLVLA